MTKVLVTIDTELSIGSFKRGLDVETNLAQSIFGECCEGAFGIAYQMKRLDAHRLTGVFFVDPMPAAVFGPDQLRRTVAPILDGGHEVQLHLHTEWLPFMAKSPVGDRHGTKMRNFDLADQIRLVEFAADLLMVAGVSRPNAFRAGNYGADDTTLEALAANGIRYDSSFNPIYLGRECRIGLPPSQIDVIERCGVTEVPISVISEWPDRVRHAQLCAVSSWEMASGLRAAVAQAQSVFTIVLHSFELLSRDRQRVNRLNVDRLDRLCAMLGGLREQAPTTGFRMGPPGASAVAPRPAAHNLLRTAHRMIEQLVSNWRYEKPRRAA